MRIVLKVEVECESGSNVKRILLTEEEAIEASEKCRCIVAYYEP